MKIACLNTVVAVCIAFMASGQSRTSNVPALSFADSVRVALENTRNVDATVIGSAFTGVWQSINLGDQQLIRRHLAQMKRKRYPFKPHLLNYLGSLTNAVNVERADPSILSAYLATASKVIELEAPAKANNFFQISRDFFHHHLLKEDKGYHLSATTDRYSFEYIDPVIPAEDDLGEEEESSDESNDASEEQPVEEVIENSEPLPMWMTPAPPPPLLGAVIRFEKLNLNIVTPYDSVSLKDTKGSLLMTEGLFIGEGGTFDWRSAMLNPDSVYCEFTQYTFDIKRPVLKADLVKLNYVGRTPGLIPGTFEFKSIQRKDSVASTFPRFKSYQADLSIAMVKDKNVSYTGGFSIIGNRITSESAGGEPASIIVSRNGEIKFKAQAPSFTFNPNSITSNRARINILQGNDSLVHPAVRMKYTFASDTIQHLLLMEEKGDMRNAPYATSFFNIDFSADVIQWNMASDSMDIRTDGGRATIPMIIESIDYYDIEDYRLLGGQGFPFHPLTLLVSHAVRNNITEFYPADINLPERDQYQLKKAIEFLRQKGLIELEAATGLIKIKPKAFTIYKAYKGEADYDNVKIHSVIDSFPNATLNFKQRHLTVRGVEEFQVSDSLNVRIEPDSSIITILQNRDIKFNGMVDAGNFKIIGKGFTLRYDSFLIDLAHIDSVNFYVTEVNAKGQRVRKKINNSLQGTDSTSAAVGGIAGYDQKSGTLYISKSSNKSGRERLPNYPRLDASAGGVIYFDRKEVLNGVYDRSMFFVVPPFKLDSLNDADPASINFDGTFVSSGMFPNFKEKLHTQPDKSLGFNHIIPPGGYPLYKGEAKMNGELSLDNRGLRGKGEISYLAAKISSEDFIYYPDSVIGRGQRASIAKEQFGNVLFPQASLHDFEMKWYPKTDRMILKNKSVPFSFYDSTAQLQGVLTISKNGVSGLGRFETRGTELVSRDMKFTGNDFSARHGRFKVKTGDPDKPLLFGNDVRLKFNLEQNYADISPEVAGVAALDFPYAQVKTSIQKARWDINAQKIIMTKDPATPIEDSYFYTTRKELDSLSFNASSAEYNLQTQELKVDGIPYIVVADAKITPENGSVLILENARIGTLKNTTIVLDTLNGYHLLTEGVVDIVSRKEFSGYATYQYVNLLKDTFAIKMTDFHLEPVTPSDPTKRTQRRQPTTNLQTVATGSVGENEQLVLGAGLFYKGNLIMYATRPALQLDGYVKLDIKNIPNYNTWLKYTQSGEETDVKIKFAEAVTEEGKRATAGLHFSSTDHDLYMTFVNDKKNDDDDNFFTPEGMLFYENESKEYRIEDPEKAAGNKLSGKVFSYNDEKKTVRFEGPVRFFGGSKDFNVSATTIGTGSFETNEFKMNSLVMIDNNVPPQAFEIMGRNLQDIIKNEGGHEGLGDHTELLYKIADVVGEDLAKQYEKASLQGYVPLGSIQPLARPLVFADVNLKWSHKQKAFYSEGLLGISNAFKTDINGGFEGFMEIRKTEDGAPVFHVFFKASSEAWYYIGFEDNRLMLHSSNGEFNDIISKKSNAGKAKIGEVAFIPGSDDETLEFINRYRKLYYGIDVPYSLSDGSEVMKKEKTEKKKSEDDDGF